FAESVLGRCDGTFGAENRTRSTKPVFFLHKNLAAILQVSCGSFGLSNVDAKHCRVRAYPHFPKLVIRLIEAEHPLKGCASSIVVARNSPQKTNLHENTELVQFRADFICPVEKLLEKLVCRFPVTCQKRDLTTNMRIRFIFGGEPLCFCEIAHHRFGGSEESGQQRT